MISTLIHILIGAVLGGGAVFWYLHTKQSAAVAAATNLANAVDSAKADLQAAKKVV